MLSLKNKIKMWIGGLIVVGLFLYWILIETPCYLFSLCGVGSAFLLVLALYLTLGTYGSRNLEEDE